jgi:hypothetical protein
MKKPAYLWIFAIVLTLIFVVYQRLTGPTHPIRGSVELNDFKIKYKLIRSSEGQTDALIKVKVPSDDITGVLSYKRYKTDDEWTEVAMKPEEGILAGYLPGQPPAGKLAYRIELSQSGQTVELTEEPVIIRFKGVVSKIILWPHILFMFTAMLMSTRTGLEALVKGRRTLLYAWITLITLGIGGLILGPAIQWQAFGDWWTGWPFGQDLTDNKTAVSFIFWVIAVIRLRKHPEKPTWAIVAAVVLLAVYLIPHSVLGSEFDYAAGEVTTGNM